VSFARDNPQAGSIPMGGFEQHLGLIQRDGNVLVAMFALLALIQPEKDYSAGPNEERRSQEKSGIGSML